jgi:hypothetical protein
LYCINTQVGATDLKDGVTNNVNYPMELTEFRLESWDLWEHCIYVEQDEYKVFGGSGHILTKLSDFVVSVRIFTGKALPFPRTDLQKLSRIHRTATALLTPT